MFSSKDYLERKTGPDDVDRFHYLQALVTEYQDTEEEDCKQQVLANLANFAYDPINYDFMRRLNILDLFLDSLEEQDEKLVEFGLGGLCNACLDKKNKEHILRNGGVPLVIKCLSSCSEETVMSAITALMYLITPKSQADITILPVVECMLRFAACPNTRLSNLATVFIEDYCSAHQVEEARKFQKQMAHQQLEHTASASAFVTS
ncbi:armadillo repeat-containing protein 7-like [Babylonia areolata]|uniref:armadillo repeat-containing protein 7-like n=1 Tax=Babylonia areolata TaxID=304850 RepID=UPI003FD3AE5D